MDENHCNELSPATFHWVQEIQEKFNSINGRHAQCARSLAHLRPALKDYVLCYYPHYVRMNGSDDPYKMIKFLMDANKRELIHSILT